MRKISRSGCVVSFPNSTNNNDNNNNNNTFVERHSAVASEALHGLPDFVCDPTRPTDKIRTCRDWTDKVRGLVGHPSRPDRTLLVVFPASLSCPCGAA